MAEQKIIGLYVGGTLGELTGSMTIRGRRAMAVQHVCAAAHFARSAKLIEDAHAGEAFGGFFDEIIWNVSASVLMSCNAIEANINETLMDQAEDVPVTEEMKAKLHTIIADKTLSIFSKYECLAGLRGAKLEKGRSAYQNAQLLVGMRNELVHFRSEWTDETGQHANLSKKLLGKFGRNPFLPNEASIFPLACFSYACAKWSVKAATGFVAEFSKIVGLPNRFEASSARLSLS